MDGLRLVEPLRSELDGHAGRVRRRDRLRQRRGPAARALAAGFDSFFVKPLNPDSLANLLRSYPPRPPERPARARASAHLVEGARLDADRVAFLGGVFLEPVVERLQADAERGRGLFLVAAEVLERGERDLALDLGQRACRRGP